MFGADQSRFFEQVLFKVSGRDLRVNSMHFVSGGCISNTVKLETDEGTFFIKWSEEDDRALFQAEAEGLNLLRQAGALRVPDVLDVGHIEQRAYLLMEYIRSTPEKPAFWQEFGQKLAQLHRHTHEQYGLDHDNFIGSLAQSNEWMDNWVDFFIEKRLNVQLGLAYYNGLIDEGYMKRFKQLYPKLPDLLPTDQPALLHGDLWNGNVMTDENGEVCVIDPAVYFGHREIELAFTRLFGGFDAGFYSSYQEAYPLVPGFEERVAIYNLYPLLVHVNLFGTSYLSGVTRVIDRYVG